MGGRMTEGERRDGAVCGDGSVVALQERCMVCVACGVWCVSVAFGVPHCDFRKTWV